MLWLSEMTRIWCIHWQLTLGIAIDLPAAVMGEWFFGRSYPTALLDEKYVV
jgi:hypothetical protein